MPFKLYRRDKSGPWHYDLSVDARRERRSTRTTDKRLASDIASQREHDLRRAAVHGPASVLTFGAAVKHYLDAGKPDRFLLRLLDRWERTRVASITAGEVKAAGRALYPTAGPATVNRQVITPACAVINHAAELGLCAPIKVKRLPVPKVKRRAVDRAWLDAFMGGASPDLAALALFGFTTGTRIGKAVALRWSDVSLEDRTATIGKDKNGDPHVARLVPELVDMLATLERDREKVFDYATRHSVYGPWDTACARAGIDYVSPHQAGRHSFATAMLGAGVDLATIARRGNWKSSRLLLDTYAHETDDDAALERAFGTSVAHDTTNDLKENGNARP